MDFASLDVNRIWLDNTNDAVALEFAYDQFYYTALYKYEFAIPCW